MESTNLSAAAARNKTTPELLLTVWSKGADEAKREIEDICRGPEDTIGLFFADDENSMISRKTCDDFQVRVGDFQVPINGGAIFYFSMEQLDAVNAAFADTKSSGIDNKITCCI